MNKFKALGTVATTSPSKLIWYVVMEPPLLVYDGGSHITLRMVCDIPSTITSSGSEGGYEKMLLSGSGG